jgi:hypothetical protein
MSNLLQQLATLGSAHGLPENWLAQRSHLFSEATVTLSAAQIAQVNNTIRAIERVVALPAYQQQALAQAPTIAQHDPGTASVLFGYDFHLTADGVKLIEINTNAGGAFVTALLHQAQTDQFATWQQRLLEMFFTEWRMKRGEQPLQRVAIVDQDSAAQFLYPEFLILQQWLKQHNIDCVIADPQQLSFKNQQLCVDNLSIDLVYNRLTDFMLAEPEHNVLAQAYQADAIVLTPHPHAHALYANKNNLVLLSNATLLQQWGVADKDIEVLLQVVPHTVLVTPAQADNLWNARKQLFFKPLAGHASKGTYRGSKLTRGVFDDILRSDYVAQEFVPASEQPVGETSLKVDLRAYVYRGEVLGFVARLYQGQVTNMQTAGGGFAVVETSVRGV